METMPTHVNDVMTGEVHLRLDVITQAFRDHAHRGRGDVNQNVNDLGGSQPCVVGGVDGDVVLTVVETLAVVVVDNLIEGEDVAGVLTGANVWAVAGGYIAGVAVGLVVGQHRQGRANI